MNTHGSPSRARFRGARSWWLMSVPTAGPGIGTFETTGRSEAGSRPSTCGAARGSSPRSLWSSDGVVGGNVTAGRPRMYSMTCRPCPWRPGVAGRRREVRGDAPRWPRPPASAAQPTCARSGRSAQPRRRRSGRSARLRPAAPAHPRRPTRSHPTEGQAVARIRLGQPRPHKTPTSSTGAGIGHQRQEYSLAASTATPTEAVEAHGERSTSCRPYVARPSAGLVEPRGTSGGPGG